MRRMWRRGCSWSCTRPSGRAIAPRPSGCRRWRRNWARWSLAHTFPSVIEGGPGHDRVAGGSVPQAGGAAARGGAPQGRGGCGTPAGRGHASGRHRRRAQVRRIINSVSQTMHTNRLANEKSPYLLQHAHNPVDWYPWGEEAFEKARQEEQADLSFDRLFDLPLVPRDGARVVRKRRGSPELLNRDYVAIKVDREERPDVDRIYMTFVQATTGGGGWPMSVWLTPELQPFFGGTYFPPENRWGHPGFGSVLTQIAEAWQTRPGDRSRNRRATWWSNCEKQTAVDACAWARVPFDAATARQRLLRCSAARSMRELGGFGGAPKFPRPVGLQLPAALLRADRQPRSAGHGAADAARDGQGRHARSARRRLPPLLGGRALVRAALREDALRPGPTGRLLPGGLPDHGRRPVRRNGARRSSIMCCAT